MSIFVTSSKQQQPMLLAGVGMRYPAGTSSGQAQAPGRGEAESRSPVHLHSMTCLRTRSCASSLRKPHARGSARDPVPATEGEDSRLPSEEQGRQDGEPRPAGQGSDQHHAGPPSMLGAGPCALLWAVCLGSSGRERERRLLSKSITGEVVFQLLPQPSVSTTERGAAAFLRPALYIRRGSCCASQAGSRVSLSAEPFSLSFLPRSASVTTGHGRRQNSSVYAPLLLKGAVLLR
ncbi:Hypothetical predicted protein [Podarcis lilfordi]|uniref:Uncharacterized protein n=1 Tax=Podarcis lilfordi TaxID=74358 RepID=A0AA35JS77_9SAUR|nr:Hypothetical predicted protein [Podarcis lilfordi]